MTFREHVIPSTPTVHDRMTPAARGYLIVKAVFMLVYGWFILGDVTMFDNPAFSGQHSLLPWTHWGALFTISGLVLAYAAIRSTSRFARFSLSLSCVTMVAWAMPFFAAWAVLDLNDAKRAFPAYMTLAIIDYIMLRQPMRTPFEPLPNKIQEILVTHPDPSRPLPTQDERQAARTTPSTTISLEDFPLQDISRPS